MVAYLYCIVLYWAFLQPTPSNKYQAPEVSGVWSEGHEDETVEVQAFYEDPVIVGGQEIDEEQHRYLAANLITEHDIKISFIPLAHHTNYYHTTSSTKREQMGNILQNMK